LIKNPKIRLYINLKGYGGSTAVPFSGQQYLGWSTIENAFSVNPDTSHVDGASL
jgi:hypothetical protein